MEEVKNIFTSKTIWGVIITLVGSVMEKFGFETTVLNGLEGEIVTVVGAALAVYGRIKAVKKIG